MADTISNVFSAGVSNVSPSTSAIASKLLHPGIIELPVVTPTEVNSPNTPTIATFDLEMNQYLDLEENKENCEELSDKDMTNYMHMFEKNITKGGMFQGCTINNPVFNITIQK